MFMEVDGRKAARKVKSRKGSKRLFTDGLLAVRKVDGS